MSFGVLVYLIVSIWFLLIYISGCQKLKYIFRILQNSHNFRKIPKNINKEESMISKNPYESQSYSSNALEIRDFHKASFLAQ